MARKSVHLSLFRILFGILAQSSTYFPIIKYKVIWLKQFPELLRSIKSIVTSLMKMFPIFLFRSQFFSLKSNIVLFPLNCMFYTLPWIIIYLWVCFLTLTMPPSRSTFYSKALRIEFCKQYPERQIAVWWINNLLQWTFKYKFGATCNYHQVSQILPGHINNWKCLRHKEFLL